mgnify:CR=1 FL=1
MWSDLVLFLSVPDYVMQSILDTLWGLILGLLGVVVAGVAIIEVMARSVLGSLGIQGQVQTVLLFLLLGGLILGAFRVFGKLFAVLLGAGFAVFFWLVVWGVVRVALIWVPTSSATTFVSPPPVLNSQSWGVWMMRISASTISGSARVDRSPNPSVSPQAILRRRRRTLFPERVLGRSGTTWIRSGAA